MRESEAHIRRAFATTIRRDTISALDAAAGALGEQALTSIYTGVISALQAPETVSAAKMLAFIAADRLEEVSILTEIGFIKSYNDDAAGTVAWHIAKSILARYELREELVTRNVARLVKLRTWERREIHPWSADEASQFLHGAETDPLYPAFMLLMLHGLRRGEVLGLRWCDVDFDSSVLQIRQQVQRVGGALRQGPVKTRPGDAICRYLSWCGTY
jgi:integrase